MVIFRICLFLLITTSLFGVEEMHKLNVSSQSILYKKAEKFKLRIGIVTMENNAEKAIKSNNEKMQLLLKAMAEQGLTDQEFQTGVFSVVPQYNPPPKNNKGEWQPGIIGYEVRNTLSIETIKLGLAGPLIDAAAKAGANLFEEISFSLQEIQSAEAEAVVKAVQQAHAYAKAAADAAGIALGEVLELNLNSANVTPRFLRPLAMAAAESTSSIVPGNVEVAANVSMTYAVKNMQKQ